MTTKVPPTMTTSMQNVIQMVTTTNNTPDSTTTTIPLDASIPQNTEGKETMTVTITPTNSSNILVIEWGCQASTNAIGRAMIFALFQDSTADAIAAQFVDNEAGNTYTKFTTYRYQMTAGTTSSTTFKLRYGPHTAGTMYIHSSNGSAQTFGGLYPGYLTVTEYKA